MRFLAGLRLVLAVAALIGLIAGPTVVAPMADARAGVATALNEAVHDCCGNVADAASVKAGLPGQCSGLGCPMAVPALLPSPPGIAQATGRSADETIVATGLEGRVPAPPLEPPRA